MRLDSGSRGGRGRGREGEGEGEGEGERERERERERESQVSKETKCVCTQYLGQYVHSCMSREVCIVLLLQHMCIERERESSLAYAVIVEERKTSIYMYVCHIFHSLSLSL